MKTMGVTPDRRPGPLDEEGIYMEPSVAPTVNGELRYVSGVGFRFFEEGAAVSLLTDARHRELYTLVHGVDETSYDEVIYSGNNITQYIVWTSVAKTLKIREDSMTYSGGKVTQVVSKQYDGAGVLVAQYTEDYSYSGNKISSVARTRNL